MPVHGEWRHMFANAELAKQTGVAEDHVVLAEDGVVVDLVAGKAGVVGVVDCGYIYVDGTNIGGTDEALLKDRRILRDEGFITCIVVLDAATGKIASGPEITARGFVEDEDIFQQVIPKVERAVEEAVANGVRDDHQLQQVVRRAVGSWVGGKIRRRPMIIPVVLQA
jgi:ribonuclease J